MNQLILSQFYRNADVTSIESTELGQYWGPPELYAVCICIIILICVINSLIVILCYENKEERSL
jgi:hypothetical protein